VNLLKEIFVAAGAIATGLFALWVLVWIGAFLRALVWEGR
jgi:hypothetical protein